MDVQIKGQAMKTRLLLLDTLERGRTDLLDIVDFEPIIGRRLSVLDHQRWSDLIYRILALDRDDQNVGAILTAWAGSNDIPIAWASRVRQLARLIEKVNRIVSGLGLHWRLAISGPKSQGKRRRVEILRDCRPTLTALREERPVRPQRLHRGPILVQKERSHLLDLVDFGSTLGEQLSVRDHQRLHDILHRVTAMDGDESSVEAILNAWVDPDSTPIAWASQVRQLARLIAKVNHLAANLGLHWRLAVSDAKCHGGARRVKAIRF